MNIQVKKTAQLRGHAGSIYALAKGMDGQILFSGGSDKIMASWNISSNEPNTFTIKTASSIYAICTIKELGLILIGTGNGGIHVINYLEKKEVKLLKPHNKAIFNIKYSIKNNLIYSVSADGTASTYNIDDFSHYKTVRICSQKIRGIDLNSGEDELAIACGDWTVRIFDAQTFIEKKSFTAHNDSVNTVKYHPNGKYLLSGGKDAYLNIWETQNYQLVKSVPAHNFALYDIAFNPSSLLFATASRDKTIKIWDAETFEFITRLDFAKAKGHLNSVNCLMWDSETGQLLSTGDDKTIIIWDIT